MDLLDAVNEQGKALFWVSLLNRKGYREGIKTLRYWYRQGAKLLVFHTARPSIIQHAHKMGFVPMWHTEEGVRMLGGPAQIRLILKSSRQWV